MNDYQFPVPRVAFGFAAAVLSALTFGVMVVLPASIEGDNAIVAASKDAVGPCTMEPLQARADNMTRATRAEARRY